VSNAERLAAMLRNIDTMIPGDGGWPPHLWWGSKVFWACDFVGPDVINGVLDELETEGTRKVSDRLTLRPFPYAITDPQKRRSRWVNYRRQMISLAGVATFVFGNKTDSLGNIVAADGMIEEFNIARHNKRLVVPIGATRYVALDLHKRVASTGNFGMGEKVASLPSNQIGMRYRSCKAGRVHAVVLCKRDGVYDRPRRYDPETGEHVEVIDVTEIAVKDGRSSEYEWTEVVLLGNASDQDTVKDPYNGNPEQDGQWIATYLYHRFYRLASGVKVALLKGTNKLDGNRQFLPISARLNLFERHETVPVPGGLTGMATNQLFVNVHYPAIAEMH
jgi:hypothetical protein